MSEDQYFSHCCNRGGVAITPDGISFIPGCVFQGTASRWLHIIAGLYTALLCFRKKYAHKYSVVIRGERTIYKLYSYSEYEKKCISKEVWGDHEREYNELRMDFHFRSDASATIARKISRLLASRDYGGIRRLRLANS